MYNCTRNYINGEWVESTSGNVHDIINPATEQSIGKVSFGTAQDVDRAVAAARAAFEEYSQWTVEQRLVLLGKIVEAYVFVGAVYWIICFSMSRYAAYLEVKYQAGQH